MSARAGRKPMQSLRLVPRLVATLLALFALTPEATAQNPPANALVG
jgi:hypothetical protein